MAGRVTKLRLKPPSDKPAGQDGEPSLLGGRFAAATKTASKADRTKTCLIRKDIGFRRCLERGEVRLYRFPPPGKARPVLILTRASAIGYLSRVTVAPITSAIRSVPSEVALGPEDGLKQPCAVNLHNLVTVSKDGLGRRVALLGEDRMRDVCAAIGFALGCGG